MENDNYSNRRPFLKQHWVPPILLAILLLPVFLLLPWQSQKIEFEDRQEQLIADTLWLEQGIHTMLFKDEDYVRGLGQDIANHRISLQQVTARVTALLKNRPEMAQLVWLDDQQQVQYSSRPFRFESLSPNSKQTLRLACSVNLPQYAQPEPAANASQINLMDYHYPLFDGQKYIGSLLVSYKLATILERVVPWWFAKDHEISIVDMDDKVLALRADAGSGKNVFVHNKSLDLPGVSLILRANSNKFFPQQFSTFLILIVIVLVVGLSWSLWALWRDIVRRQAAETALRSEIAFRNAMEKSLVTGLRVRSMDGQLVYVNPAFCEMVGLSEAQLLGQKLPFSFWTLEAFEDYSKGPLIRAATDAGNGFETVYKHANGQRIPVLIYESALLDENGTQTGWMGSILDISERKRSEQILRQHEEKLQRSARLLTMGELASIMAHELNQPLTAINTYASGILNMMRVKEVQVAEIQPALAQMQKQAFRAAQIIRSVHDFVAKRAPCRVAMQFGEVMKNVIPLIELQAKSYLVKLKVQVEHPLPDVYIDPISIEQVILNVTRNALQSMQELTLEQRALEINVKQIDTFVCIEVIDNGPGIPKEIAERLFSPFFSTKAEGMGMGLNICRTIIELHGGQLTFRDNPAGGTIFSFSVPVFLDVSHESDRQTE